MVSLSVGQFPVLENTFTSNGFSLLQRCDDELTQKQNALLCCCEAHCFLSAVCTNVSHYTQDVLGVECATL